VDHKSHDGDVRRLARGLARNAVSRAHQRRHHPGPIRRATCRRGENGALQRLPSGHPKPCFPLHGRGHVGRRLLLRHVPRTQQQGRGAAARVRRRQLRGLCQGLHRSGGAILGRKVDRRRDPHENPVPDDRRRRRFSGPHQSRALLHHRLRAARRRSGQRHGGEGRLRPGLGAFGARLRRHVSVVRPPRERELRVLRDGQVRGRTGLRVLSPRFRPHMHTQCFSERHLEEAALRRPRSSSEVLYNRTHPAGLLDPSRDLPIRTAVFLGHIETAVVRYPLALCLPVIRFGVTLPDTDRLQGITPVGRRVVEK
jgi:hypothetical protein